MATNEEQPGQLPIAPAPVLHKTAGGNAAYHSKLFDAEPEIAAY